VLFREVVQTGLNSAVILILNDNQGISQGISRESRVELARNNAETENIRLALKAKKTLVELTAFRRALTFAVLG
jgi:uncharacterized protein YpmB